MDIFNAKLRSLRSASKSSIMELTSLAKEHISCASSIIEAINDYMNEANQTLKLPVLYLMDSIFKNVAGPYQTFYAKYIDEYFSHVLFNATPEQMHELKKLKDSWQRMLHKETLELLESRISFFQYANPEEEALIKEIAIMTEKLKSFEERRRKRKADETPESQQEYERPCKRPNNAIICIEN